MIIKRLFLFLITTLSTLSFVYSQVYVSGQVLNAPENARFKITFFNNTIEYIDRTAVNELLDENGKFSATFEREKSGEANLNVEIEYSRMYLNPRDSLYITIDYNSFDSTIHYEGKGKEANNFLAKQTLSFLEKRAYRHSKDMDPFLYLEYVDSIQNKNKDLLNSFNSDLFSEDFENYIKSYLKYRFVDPKWMFKVDFSQYDENGKPFYKELPDDYYDFIWNINLNDQKAYDNTYYSNALSRYIYEAQKKLEPINDTVDIKELLFYKRRYYLIKSLFTGKVLDFQLTKFMNHYTPHLQKYEKWNELREDYKLTCKTPEYIQMIENLDLRTKNLASGKPAPNFVLENFKGDTVSLASLKGKVVYIDFWATWCSPCLSTLFKTEELVEEFIDNENVVIVFINIKDNKEKWSNYVEAKNVKGLHLYADEEQSKELFMNYNFNGLPHYVLIGKNGEMLDANVTDSSSLINRIESYSKK